jgi:hypothetical protein
MDTKKLKTIAAWVIAIIIAFIFMSLALTVMRLAISAIFNIGIIVLLLIMALPLYVIIRRSLLK